MFVFERLYNRIFWPCPEDVSFGRDLNPTADFASDEFS